MHATRIRILNQAVRAGCAGLQDRAKVEAGARIAHQLSSLCQSVHW